MTLIPRSLREHPVATILGFCLFVGVLLVIRNLVSFANSSQDPAIVAIRQAGYPVTLSDLNSFYPPVADDQNAAILYQEAFGLESFTNNVFDELTANLSSARGEAVPEAIRVGLAEAFATNGRARQLLYSATNLAHSRFPLDFRDGHMVLLPHLAKIKRAAVLLSVEAHSHASAGDADKAYGAYNAALHVGDSIREEPLLISFLVRIACSALVAKRLEQSLNLVAFSEESLRSLQDRFAAADDSRLPARALAGERTFGLSFFIDRHIQGMLTNPQQGAGMVPSGIGGQLMLSAYRASGLMGKDQQFYLKTMGKSVALAELPAQERIQSGPPPSMVSSNRFLIFSRMMLPALQRALDRADEHSARMRVVETALGVERFRAAHAGALPDNLEQLTPKYLRSVPLDPFDSQPLRYKKLPRGFVVYSVGADQKDDGGAEPPPSSKTGSLAKAAPRDLTFTVERN
jgi:hypothetical protein